jgi:hypothetical protein
MNDWIVTTSDAHARVTDPISSELTVASLGRDVNYRKLVVKATSTMQTMHANYVCDDDVLACIEHITMRRHQRNVIARTRGLLEREGWIERGPMITRPDGRAVISYRLTPDGFTIARRDLRWENLTTKETP